MRFTVKGYGREFNPTTLKVEREDVRDAYLDADADSRIGFIGELVDEDGRTVRGAEILMCSI